MLMAKMTMIRRWVNLFLVVTSLQCVALANGRRYGMPETSLHFPSQDFNDQWGDGFRVVQIPKTQFHEESASSPLLRNTRSAEDDTGNVDPQHMATEVSLSDSHTTLIMHWAGEGSDIIIALAKSSSEISSNVFVSEDYGKSFVNKTHAMNINATTPAVIHKYYNTRLFKTNYIFSDVKHNCIFTTRDVRNFERTCYLPFKPRVLAMNPEDYSLVLGLDDESPAKDLYLSTNFGQSWTYLYSNIKTFFWGVPPYDDATKTIYIHETINGKGRVMKITLIRNSEKQVESLSSDIIDFHVRDSYLYMTRSVNLLGAKYNPHKQLWVSHDRGRLQNAEFPFERNMIPVDYYVVDASEGQLMVCVSFTSSPTNLYISEVKGFRFTLSLERVVYFNPKNTNQSSWIRFYTNETFADVTKVGGIAGVYIASQMINQTLEVDAQRTLISFDKGGVWKAIPRPTNNDVPILDGCGDDEKRSSPSNFKLTNCSLHLTQEFHHLYPGAQTSPILSQKSAPGLILASGVIGKTLKSNPDVFLSSDAGLSWKAVLSGKYLYSLGDHGGMLMAVEQFVAVNELIYSIDEGETWHSYRFVQDKIRVYGLLTEPGEKTTVISVFGSHTTHHSWLIIQVDFHNIFNEKSCSEEDYKWWSIDKDLNNRDWCLMGHTTEYRRRLAHAFCYNGQDFVRQVQTKNCTCTRQDYECDLGFMKSLYTEYCRAIPGIDRSDVHPVPSPCPPGTFYPYSRGYRKVSGDTCQGGLEHKYGPLLYSCPFSERDDFLLVTAPDELATYNFRQEEWVTLIREPGLDLATFDYQANCVIYFRRPNLIKKLCFGSNRTEDRSEHIVKHHRNGSVDCLGFDWTGRTLFICDHTAHTITVLNLDGTLERQIYNAAHGITEPRSLVLDPHHGYFYFVDRIKTSENTHGIYRLIMDGSDTKPTLLVNNSFVTHDTSLAFNIETEELYWVSPSKGKLYSSDVSGKSVRVVDSSDSLSSAIDLEIYKNDFIIMDSSRNTLRSNSINNPSRFWTSLSPFYSLTLKSIQVVSSTSQHAMSACSDYHNKCSQLCLPRPNANPDVNSDHQNRTCLCGEGFRRQKISQNSRDETCRCEQGEKLNGSMCVKVDEATTCANDKLTCGNGRCVLLTWKCDGADDCDDNTDELDCPYATCGEGTFTCANGKCISDRWVCDREDDCKDGHATDERSCRSQTCNADQFHCANGYCIQKTWVCDGDNDCYDMSDEHNCSDSGNPNKTMPCRTWEFSCGDGDCVSLDSRCDGQQECLDGSDERGCEHTNCSAWQFPCQNGMCILDAWRCDDYPDCEDGSDEVNCTNPHRTVVLPPTTTSPDCGWNSFTCDNGNCVGFIIVCNGIDDCGDYSDEHGCGGTTDLTTKRPAVRTTTLSTSCDNSDKYVCPGIQDAIICIPRSWLCDGKDDCPDGADEKHCKKTGCTKDQFMCHVDGYCIPATKFCDKQRDCPDNSDEWDCDHKILLYNYTCQMEEFSCGDAGKTCIPFTSVCDRADDCINYSDETANCEVCRYGKELVYSPQAIPECMSSPKHCPAVVWEESHNTSISWFWTRMSNVTIAYRPLNLPNEQKVIYSKVVVPSTDNKATVRGLLPATLYTFVFLEAHGPTLCPLGSVDRSTKEGLPSLPENFHVQAKVLPGSDIDFVLLWDKPKIPRGKILTFHVYRQEVDKDLKPVSQVETQEYKEYAVASNNSWGYDKHFGSTYALDIVLAALSDGSHSYQFWVAACTSFGQGQVSKKMTVDLSKAQRDVDLNLGAKATDETTLALTWKRDPAAVSYVIIGQSSGAQNNVKLSVGKDKTSSYLTGLCPGWPAMVSIQSVYKTSKGSKYTSKRAVLKGTFPHIDRVNVTRTGPTSVYVMIVPKDKYKIYYIYYSHHGISSDGQSLYKPKSITTAETAIEIKGLEACERYFLAVVPAYKSCPLQMLQSFITMEEDQAPPKDLRYHLKKVSDHYTVRLTWHASCYHMSHPLRYIITLRKSSGPPSEAVTANETDTIDVQFDLKNLDFGQSYTLSVRADVVAARNTHPVVVKIPEAQGPMDLRVIYEDEKQRKVRLTWLWDKSKYQHFKEYIVTTHSRYGTFKAVNQTIENQFVLTLPSDGDYNYTVTAWSDADEIIGMSYTLEFVFYTPDGVDHHSSSPLSKTNLVAIMVPVAVVVVVLSAGLVFFFVRHRRLQRSFLAFANSHYNIQSGTTTFSEDLDGDEPMIQGFADDEPLVIA